MRLSGLVGGTLICCAVGAVNAAPPKVVRAMPDHADIGVDPELKELRIEFDHDMDHDGRSICGGGPAFPKIDGTITWADARTIVIPVKLEPGKTYSLSVNCPAAQNFTSVKGESAEVYPISFATRKPGESASELTEEQAEKMMLALRRAIDERYSYRDLRGVDWAAVFKEHAQELAGAKTPSEFARAAARTLVPARDVHMTLRVGDIAVATHRVNLRPNVNMTLLPRLVKQWKQYSPRVYGGEYAKTPYLLITDWSGLASDYKPVFEFLEKYQDAPGLILDVRPNSGGDELLAKSVAACFVRKAAVYSTNKTRSASAPGGWT